MIADRTVSELRDRLKRNREHIETRLHVSAAQWSALVARLGRQDRKHGTLHDEQVWTFLLGAGYALAEDGVALLGEKLTEGSQVQQQRPCDRIWFEVLPLPPRKNEGNTNIDLALGALRRRGTTKSGIILDPGEPSWVCFCEMKWHSDISHEVSHDPHRNQLGRIIENAICMGGEEDAVGEVHVTLVTPALYKNPSVNSRLYQYKYSEYSVWQNIFDDLKECELPKASAYPGEDEIRKRLRNLQLHWVTYNDLFEALPSSDLAGPIRQLWSECGSSE